jgi:VIT1/CCC1 family predicted Fe2+/Mn2+ transporter
MDETRVAARERLLDPVSRISEILFGLIMALTFTGTLSAATADHEEVRTLLLGALGCNVAWGLVDAVMYLVTTLTERGRNLMTVREVHAAPDPAAAHRVIAGALSPVMASVLTNHDVERLRQGVLRIRELPPRPRLMKDDWLRALGVFLLVFLSTFPIVIPFLVFSEVHVALRASNLVAIVMLFAAGYMLARYGGYRPVLTGSSMVLLGVTLVGIAIALGG